MLTSMRTSNHHLRVERLGERDVKVRDNRREIIFDLRSGCRGSHTRRDLGGVVLGRW